MAITTTEFLEDRVRVHYCCERPWGEFDEEGVVEVRYEDLPALPAPPPILSKFNESRRTWEESVFIPTRNVTISWQFAEWQETDDFRMQELVGGPYLGISVQESPSPE